MLRCKAQTCERLRHCIIRMLSNQYIR